MKRAATSTKSASRRQRHQMTGEDEAIRHPGEFFPNLPHRHLRAEGQGGERRQLDVRAGEQEGAQCAYAVRGRRRLGDEGIRGQVAHIAVRGELYPRPAVAILVIDGDRFAPQRLGVQRRSGEGLRPQRRHGLRHHAASAGGITGRDDDPAQAFGPRGHDGRA